MPNKTDVIPLVVGLSLCGASAALLYIWFQTKDAADECDAAAAAAVATVDSSCSIASSCVRRLSRHLSQSGSGGGGSGAAKSERRHIECVIPNHLVPLVEGRAGANVRAIADQTGCQIRFRPRDASTQMCEISGPSAAAVQRAADLVSKEAAPPPIVTEVLCVPQSACALIVGRCGEALQDICRRSMAKVYVDAGGHQATTSGDTEAMRTIKITGTVPHVQMARTMIEEKIHDTEQQQAASKDATLRSPREPRKQPQPETVSTANQHAATAAVAAVTSTPTLGDGQLEVYVSAVASPARFWLQLVGPQSQQLDSMVTEMTEYYADEANRIAHKIADPYLGQIVAALFKYDGKWYRAEIVGILPNEYNPRNVVLDLYFVDFGDSEYVAPHEVYELRTDLLTLRFQAIECFLANVKSTNVNDSESWSPDAISRFEEITHVAQWRIMHARIVTTKDRKYGDFARRENSPVPGVELFDNNDVNIASMLMREHFAVSDVNAVRAETPVSVTPTRTSEQHAEPSVNVKSAADESAAVALETFIETEKRQMLRNGNGMSSS